MSIASTIVNGTPIFGKIFSVDRSTGLEEINAWPALMIMSSFVWLVVAGLLGLVMPTTQIFDLSTDHFYTTLTLHGAALTFPFSFQLMMGVGLHRSGGCVGKAVTGWLPALSWLSMNLGAAILTVAVLMGLKVSVVVMFPLPLVGAQMGVWSMESVIVGFTGIYLVLSCMILWYPLLVLKMMFFGKKRAELVLSERSLNDPGMLGMLLAAVTLILTGLPLVVVGTTLLLALYKILPMSLAAWAAEPVVFQYAFYLFAHNLMEAMALMVSSAMYATLPLYLADGSRKLYSEKLANLALWILLVTSVTSGLHHFITFYPNQPAALSYWGNIMSWGTGLGAAISIFTVLATIWQHGLKAGPGIIAVLVGWALYILDGASAIVTSNIVWTYQLHGTMWQSGHFMTVILAMSMMWMGVLYHHYPVLTGRKLDPALGSLYVKMFTVGAFGAAITMLAGGAAGMPRRFAAWNQEGWMIYGDLIMVFGLILGASFVVYLYNMMKSREISAPMGELARA
ncbi:MAG: cbb3-type cytochrome c oxidase subunit I [Rhodocyclaceae bacterium]|jgi:cytochrome c oxidase subunit 1|nr:cbb3-type cytochrome c oxidase subunit I [Rhodocyclaceae bacterium]MBK6554339.1 cbb3-type cytochrome c oxidase subunit I [Rhodocyclaceae bacterium]MBK6677709.1 cbb3-type cytochrome c oxidase subunit I [Rhodocyclaceae bacterium]MBK9310378.1 cbb3-type cytochrome c oxidase subunit I [Rhodocyclaceae bacterium]MBK9954550.1 cbb3-type cytochrome c oxidase subunit I [Rhodocyclaceae bacterium]